MRELKGKVAVVTGAASGMGLAMARRFASEGMKVVMADIEEPALATAKNAIEADGGTVIAVRTDISKAADVDNLADWAVSAFKHVNVLCCNAGVNHPGGVWEQSLDDWTWVMGVNLWGVIHPLRSFVPGMLARGDEGHIVITASAAALFASNSATYGTTKWAAAGLAESLESDLQTIPGARIGVSLLCPGGVRTGIHQSGRNRPPELSQVGGPREAASKGRTAAGNPNRTDQVSPEYIADLVTEAITNGRFYVLPMQRHFKERIRRRLHRLEEALDYYPDTSEVVDGYPVLATPPNGAAT